MNDRAASFDWMTSMKATTPNTIQEKLPKFIVPTRAIAIQTHTTPDRFDAIAFCRPWVLPPAAKKQAHAMTPPGTARLAIAPTFTHRATSAPTLAASVCGGDSVLRARPSAPASRAERSDSPSLYAVSTSTLGGVAWSRRAASTAVPLIVVSSRSSTTTSGLCCCTSFTTSVPSVVQPATVMSGSPSSRARRPSSTIAWSSASRTRIIEGLSFRRQRDGERRAPPGRALERERAPQHLHAVLDAAQAEMSALHAHILLPRQHARRIEAAAPVRHGEGERAALPLDDHALLGRARVAVAVGERLLQDPVDRDLGRQRTVAEVVGEVELHALFGQRLVLDREALDDLAQRATLEPRRSERADEVPDLA